MQTKVRMPVQPAPFMHTRECTSGIQSLGYKVARVITLLPFLLVQPTIASSFVEVSVPFAFVVAEVSVRADRTVPSTHGGGQRRDTTGDIVDALQRSCVAA